MPGVQVKRRTGATFDTEVRFVQVRVHKLELSERDSLVEGAIAFMMSAESHAETVRGKRLARRNIRTAKDAAAGSKASIRELIKEIKTLKGFI